MNFYIDEWGVMEYNAVNFEKGGEDVRSGWAEATRISVKCLSKRGYDMTGGV